MTLVSHQKAVTLDRHRKISRLSSESSGTEKTPHKKKSPALCINSGFRAGGSCPRCHTLPLHWIAHPTVDSECFTRFCTLLTFFMHLEKPLCSNSSFRAGGSCPRFHTLPSIGLPTRLESHYSCRHCLLVVHRQWLHIHSKYTMYCVVIVAQNTSAL